MKGHCARYSRGGARLGPAVFAALLVFPSITSARPVVAIISPSNNAPLSGEIWVTAAFRSDSRRPISRLELQCDGRSVQELVLPTAVPEGQKSFPINLSALPAGAHELSVVAVDTAGEEGSASVTVSVSGGPGGAITPPGYGSSPGAVGMGAAAVGEYDQIPPVVSIFYPAQGATVARTVPIRVEAKDNVAVRHVLFYVDGKLHTVRMTDPPFSANWDTTQVADGPHIIEARAKDTQGNEGQAAPVTVIVRNSGPGPEPVVDPAAGAVVPGPVSSGPPVAPSPGGPMVVVPGVRQPAGDPEVAVPGLTAPPVGPTLPAGDGRETEAPPEPGVVVPRVVVPPVAVPPVPDGPGRDAADGGAASEPGHVADAASQRPPAEAAAQPAELEAPQAPTATAPPKTGTAEPPKLPSRPGPQVTVPGTGLGAAGLTPPANTPASDGGHATLKRAEDKDTSQEPTTAEPPAATAPEDEVEHAPSQDAAEPADTQTPATGPATVATPEGEAVATPEDLPEAAAPAETVPMPTADDVPLPRTTTDPPETLPATTAPGLAEPIVTGAGAVTTPGARLRLEPATAPPTDGNKPGARPEGEPEAPEDGAESATSAGDDEPATSEPAEAPRTAPEEPRTPRRATDSAAQAKTPSTAAPETVAAPAEAPPIRPAMPDGLTPTGADAYHEGPKAAAPGVALDPSQGRPAPAAARPAAAGTQPSRAVEAPDDAEPAAGTAAPPRAGLRRLPSAPRPAEAPTTAAHPEPATSRPDAVGPARPLTVADAGALKTAKVFANDRPLPDDARPELVDDTLMISLKPVFEAFEGALYWFPGDRVARGVTADTDLAVQIGSTQATLNGNGCLVEPAPVLRNGRILAPISLVGRALSVGFEFDPAANVVRIR